MLYGINLKERFKVSLFLAKPDKMVVAKLTEAYDKDISVRLDEVNELKFSIPAIVERDGVLIKNPNLELLRDRYLVKAKVGESSEWFVIVKIEDEGDDVDSKSVVAYSLGYNLRGARRVRNYKVTSKNAQQVLTDVLDKTGWSIGFIDDSFLAKFRSFDVSNQNKLDFIYEVAKTFEAKVLWDTHSKQINLLKKENIGSNKGLKIKYGKYLQSLSRTKDSNEMCTIIKAFGKDELTFNSVNPTGKDYIEDFSYFIYPYEEDIHGNAINHSYYMSDGLCKALIGYKSLIESNEGNFKSLLDDKSVKQENLILNENILIELKGELQIILDNIETQQQMGNDVSSLIIQRDAKQLEVANQQVIIDGIKGEIDSVSNQIINLGNSLKLENNFTQEQLEERYMYELEYEFNDDKYIDVDDLYSAAKEKFNEFRKPKTTLDLDIVNFLEIVECKADHDKLNVGDIVSVEYERLNIKSKASITGYDMDCEDCSINLIVSTDEKVESDDDKLQGLLNNLVVTNNTIKASKFKWDSMEDSAKGYVDNQIKEVNESIVDIYTNLDRASADGYITLSESKMLKNQLAQLNGESLDLIGVAKSLGVTTEKLDYEGALGDLSEEVNKWIDRSAYPLPITIMDRNNLQTLFNNVQSTKSKLINKISEGQSKKELDTFVTSTYNSDIKGLQDGKSESFFSESDPSSNWTQDDKDSHIGDFWFKTGEGIGELRRYNGATWDLIRDEKVNQAYENASTAQSTADGKITTYYQDIQPSSGKDGDLWIDTNDNNKMYIYNSNAWVVASDNSLLNEFITNTYDSDMLDMQGLVDDKIESFFSSSNPKYWSDVDDAKHEGDMWFDITDGSKKLKCFNGGAWKDVEDQTAIDAYTKAENAQSTADGKITTYYQNETPTSDISDGDLWFDTNDNNKLRIYNGTSWDDATDDSSLNTFIGTYTTDKGNLQDEIDGKIETFFQDVDPNTWGEGDRPKHNGDMWFDTNAEVGKLKRYNASSNTWELVEDKTAIDAYANASTAQDTADGKRTVFTSQPTTPYKVGDLWTKFETSGEVTSAGELYVCTTEHLETSVALPNDFYDAHWEKATKYTDDTRADEVDDGIRNNIVSIIEQTPETIKIQASKVDLVGQVTFLDLDNTTQGKVSNGDGAYSTLGGLTTLENETTVINGAKIKTGSINANKIETGTIKITGLDSDTQSKVNNGDNAYDRVNLNIDATNLVPNPRFEGGKSDFWTGSMTIVQDIDEGVPVNAPTKYLAKQNGRDVLGNSDYFLSQEGDKFYVEVWCASSNSTKEWSAGLHFQDEVGANTWVTLTPKATATGSWIKLSGIIATPSNVTKARPFYQINAFDTFGDWYFSKPIIRRITTDNEIESANDWNGATSTIDSWRHAQDSTVIDGGKIYANSITLTELHGDVQTSIGDGESAKSTLDDLTTTESNTTVIDGGKIKTGSIQADRISIGSFATPNDVSSAKDEAINDAKNYVDSNAIMGVAFGGLYNANLTKNTSNTGLESNGKIKVDTGVFVHNNGISYFIMGNKEIVTMLKGGGEKQAYIMFIGNDFSRFPELEGSLSKDFVSTIFENGVWKYDNGSTYLPFTPSEDDCIVAKIIEGDNGIKDLIRYANKNLETTDGATDKANQAESNAKGYTDENAVIKGVPLNNVELSSSVGLKVTHNDGSYTQMTGNGIKRYIAEPIYGEGEVINEANYINFEPDEGFVLGDNENDMPNYGIWADGVKITSDFVYNGTQCIKMYGGSSSTVTTSSFALLRKITTMNTTTVSFWYRSTNNSGDDLSFFVDKTEYNLYPTTTWQQFSIVINNQGQPYKSHNFAWQWASFDWGDECFIDNIMFEGNTMSYPIIGYDTQNVEEKEYNYLTHVGEDELYMMDGYAVNDRDGVIPVWIELPKEFKGKDFKVVVSFLEASAGSSVNEAIISQRLTVEEVDKENGMFLVKGYLKFTTDFTRSNYETLKFTYIATL